jgi:hypothetical protein
VTVKVTKWEANASGKKSPIEKDVTVKQFRYKCVIRKKMGNDTAEFSAEGVADESNVSGKSSELKIEQMAEARAMRRCLSRAFPVGLGNFEDVQDAITYETVAKEVETKVSEATKDDLAEKIASAQDMETLESLKAEIKKAGKNEYVSAYAKRIGELNNSARKDAEPKNAESKEEPVADQSETEEEEEGTVTETADVGPDQN